MSSFYRGIRYANPSAKSLGVSLPNELYGLWLVQLDELFVEVRDRFDLVGR